MLKDVMRLVILLRVPALKVAAIKRALGNLAAVGVRTSREFFHESRDPLPFAHRRFSFMFPYWMGKRRPSIFQEHHQSSDGGGTAK